MSNRDSAREKSSADTTLTPCNYCPSRFPSSELVAITTILNGIEKKEWVCSECEAEARQHEKPPVRTGGGEETT